MKGDATDSAGAGTQFADNTISADSHCTVHLQLQNQYYSHVYH